MSGVIVVLERYRLNAMNIRNVVVRTLASITLMAGAIFPLAAHASVVIAGTRMIYNAKESEVTIKLSNDGQKPALTQVWLDSGDPQADPSKLDLPFVLTPPMARIDPTKSQTIRVAYTGEALPQGKESLFWFNVLEVPPKPEAGEAGANYMQLAFRSRIKFFFRPAGLSGSVDEAPGKLGWHLETEKGRSVLQVSNPTPYHVTIIEAVAGEGGNAPKFDEGIMVGPGEKASLPLSGTVAAGAKVHFTTLNDYGGPIKHEAALQ
ncbi:fimbria/pilus periplasmic chaperone [Jeongeupia chitinilytica]|uniref:Fimbrial chaperone n=1 Tax=Jeongeupia chitinilytica TaxID=1041641 RepID=A0ABQ3H4D1_9NEIS|nr:fimbria/pilus periplasmic chaperone [Jeongeupia chitinilytica]GHD69946.1 fimbrial chaperone [Jeongeupia chitinilytica]